jgi:hypothetical protein
MQRSCLGDTLSFAERSRVQAEIAACDRRIRDAEALIRAMRAKANRAIDASVEEVRKTRAAIYRERNALIARLVVP